MEALHDRSRNTEFKDFETDLRACVQTVFDRCPELCGFSVAERFVPSGEGGTSVRDWELYVSDIAVCPAFGEHQSEQFHGEISGALGELLNERPEAAEFVTGRTFARTWH